MRVIHLLPKAHPDYHIAVSELKKIFAKLKYTASYTTVTDFTSQLDEWATKYSTYSFQDMNEKEKVNYLGNIYFFT
jgi:hypothetical protein